jgi:hypothetical protein
MRSKFIFSVVTMLLLCAGSDAQKTSLFSGKDLDGWEHVGPGGIIVQDSVMKTEGGMGLLWYTKQKFRKVVLRVVFKCDQLTSNSGVFIRIPEEPTEEWMPVNKGYEVQIDDSNDSTHCTGVLYSLTKALARPSKPSGQWNTFDITIDTNRTIVFLNGAEVTDYTEGAAVPPRQYDYEPERGPRPAEGFIGVQNHSSADVVYFKEVSITPLEDIDTSGQTSIGFAEPHRPGAPHEMPGLLMNLQGRIIAKKRGNSIPCCGIYRTGTQCSILPGFIGPRK